MSETILANATLVLPTEVITGSLRIAAGKITAIDQGQAVPYGAIDCGGDLVMPGLIECTPTILNAISSLGPR